MIGAVVEVTVCDGLNGSGEAPGPESTLRAAPPGETWWQRAVLYPSAYGWYVFLSAIDLMFTWIILHVDGREMNAIADWVISRYNVRGLILYKFLIVMTVVTICETVGRANAGLGAKLARWAVLLSAFPVIIGAVFLLLVVLELHTVPPEAG